MSDHQSLTKRRHPLLRVGLANLIAHKVRLILTVFSVVLGTAFISASLVFTATLEDSISQVFDNSLGNVDVRISSQQTLGGIPLELRDEIADKPEVNGTRPITLGGVILLNKEGEATTNFQTGGEMATGYYQNTGQLDEHRKLVKGRFPTADDELVLGEKLAQENGYRIGDTVQFITSDMGVEKATLVGLDAYDIKNIPDEILFSESRALRTLSDGKRIAALNIDLRNDLSAEAQQKFRTQLEKTYPKLQIQTGQEASDEINAQLKQSLKFVTYFLLAFGVIALVVGTFLIYNTFAMIVAQRIRELALLRAIGTTQRQVIRSVIGEAGIVGAIGSTIGLGTGIGLAYGLSVLMGKLGTPLSDAGLSVQPAAFITPLILGILVTLVSAWVPARRAGRTPPVQAMLQDSTTAVGSLTVRTILGAISLLAGVGVVIFGGVTLDGKTGLLTVGAGALLIILGLFLTGPVLAIPAMHTLGVALRTTASYKTTGKIALRNTLRSPVRTATTSFALTLGLLLVSIVGIMGSSMQSSIDHLISAGLTSDFVLTVPQGMGIPKKYTKDINRMPSVNKSAAIYYGFTKINDKSTVFTTSSENVDDLVDYQIVKGRYPLDDDYLMVSEDYANKHNLHLGSRVTVETFQDKVKVPVAGIYKHNPMLHDVVTTFPLYEKIMPENMQYAYLILLKMNGMYDTPARKAELEKVVKPLKIVKVGTPEEFAGEQATILNQVLAGLYALLALSVIIAILGVINTLALAVTERRQEIGMLRAIGMPRAQLRHMFYMESILLSIFGTLLGMIFGTLVGWGLCRVMVPYGLIDVVFPWIMILGVLLGSIVVGVVAALGPAVRASKVSPLKAIAD